MLTASTATGLIQKLAWRSLRPLALGSWRSLLEMVRRTISFADGEPRLTPSAPATGLIQKLALAVSPAARFRLAAFVARNGPADHFVRRRRTAPHPFRPSHPLELLSTDRDQWPIYESYPFPVQHPGRPDPGRDQSGAILPVRDPDIRRLVAPRWPRRRSWDGVGCGDHLRPGAVRGPRPDRTGPMGLYWLQALGRDLSSLPGLADVARRRRARGSRRWGFVPSRSGLARSFWLALATQLSNPKTLVVIGGIFAALLPARVPAWMYLAIPPIQFVIETSWYAFVAMVMSSTAPRAAYLRARTWIDRMAGGVLGVLGLRLIIESVREAG